MELKEFKCFTKLLTTNWPNMYVFYVHHIFKQQILKMFDYNQPLVIFLLNYNPLSPSILNNCTTSTSMLWEKKKGIDVLKRWSYKFYEVCIREKGGRLRNIQTTGRWNHSALASRRDFIYWSGFYVLIFLPSLCVCINYSLKEVTHASPNL